MKKLITYKDVLCSLYPELEDMNPDQILIYLNAIYTYKGIRPTITVDEDRYTIEHETENVKSDKTNYIFATMHCETGSFAKARAFLEDEIANHAPDSEYYGIMAQVLIWEGKLQEALDHMITALRLDPQNYYALLKMGKFFDEYMNDPKTAKIYYDQADAVHLIDKNA